jgi:hypothetical protein
LIRFFLLSQKSSRSLPLSLSSLAAISLHHPLFCHNHDLIELNIGNSQQHHRHGPATRFAVSATKLTIHATISEQCSFTTRPIVFTLLRRCKMAYTATPGVSLRCVSISSTKNGDVYSQRRSYGQPSPVRRHCSDEFSTGNI